VGGQWALRACMAQPRRPWAPWRGTGHHHEVCTHALHWFLRRGRIFRAAQALQFLSKGRLVPSPFTSRRRERRPSCVYPRVDTACLRVPRVRVPACMCPVCVSMCAPCACAACACVYAPCTCACVCPVCACLHTCPMCMCLHVCFTCRALPTHPHRHPRLRPVPRKLSASSSPQGASSSPPGTSVCLKWNYIISTCRDQADIC